MDILHEIQRAFARRRDAGRLDGAFEGWKERHTCLASLAGVEELIARCRDESTTYEEKDRLYAVLCREAMRKPKDDDAGVLVSWLLLPALWNAIRAVEAPDRFDDDDIAAEMLAGLWRCARRIRLDSRFVAYQLLKEAWDTACRAVRRENPWDALVKLLDQDRLPGTPYPRPEDYDDTLRSAIRCGVITREELALLLADEEEIKQVACRQGVILATAYRRRDRARERLRRWITTTSHDDSRR